MTRARIIGRDSRARGSSSLEFVISIGLWGCALAVLASAWQITTADTDVADAAGQAARAATLTAARADAVQVASATARARLSAGTCEPETIRVQVDVSQFQPGGTVHVTVSCRTDPPIGPRRTLSSTSEEIVDRYRGGL